MQVMLLLQILKCLITQHVDAAAKAVKTDAKAVGNFYTNALPTAMHGFPKALESAVKIAEMILTDKVINNDQDLNDEISVQRLAGNGYNTELVRILAKYGALGSKGSSLANAVGGPGYSSFDKSRQLSVPNYRTTEYYQQFLGELGGRAFGPSTTNNPDHSKIVSVPVSRIALSPGANITFNPSAEIDTSEIFTKENRRIAIIGAAKDMTIKGNLNIKNTSVYDEGNVMVLGAADDLISVLNTKWKMLQTTRVIRM